MAEVALHRDGPGKAPITLALTHGAGGPVDDPFLETFVGHLVARGIGVVRFEFPYMAKRRADGRRRAPDRLPMLLGTWRSVIEALGGGAGLAIGGKSLGGRMASLVADEAGVRALVCLGYPFHPAGKPDRLRTAHLESLRTPTLIVQGSRDSLGTRDEVAGYALSSAIRFHWLEDGDHSFRPRKRSGHTWEGHLAEAASACADFLGEQFA